MLRVHNSGALTDAHLYRTLVFTYHAENGPSFRSGSDYCLPKGGRACREIECSASSLTSTFINGLT